MSVEAVEDGLDQAVELRRSANWSGLARVLDRVRPQAEALSADDPTRARWTVASAEAMFMLGGSDRARALASSALRTAESGDLADVLTSALRVMGGVTWRMGDLRGGRMLLERALTHAERAEDRDNAVRCAIELSHISLDQGRLDDVDRWLRHAQILAAHDPILQLLPLPAIANSLQRRADRVGAKVAFEDALERGRSLNHALVEGMSQLGLAHLALEEGEAKLAVARVREAHASYHRVGYTFGESQCYNVLGEAHRRLGDRARAVRAYERAVRAGDAVGHPGLVPRANLAVLRLEDGRMGDAQALIEQVLQVAEARGLRPLVASMHALLLPCVADQEAKLQHHLLRAADGLTETGIFDRDLAMSARRAGELCTQPGLAVRCRALALAQWLLLDDPAEARTERAALRQLAEEGAPIPAGPFDLRQELGAGAMGEVWQARHRLGFDAAVKVVAAATKRQRLIELLEEEARAVVGLDHVNIVRLIDFGRLGADAESMRAGLHAGAPWFAMEMIRGSSLEALCGQLDWEECRGILLELLDALAHAHSRGVLHLDVKPANVLLTEAAPAQVKLLDFGLAAVLSVAGGKVRMAGTPLYMAPEQFRGESRDWGPWTDLYALGCLAVHLVTGKPPYEGPDLKTIRQAHLRGELELDLPAGVPPAFATWVRGLMALESVDRFRFAADAADALRWMDESSQTAPVAIHPGRPDVAVDRARSGLALFELRRPPLVGRKAERNALWTALREVVSKERPRVVVLRGSSGAGKTGLARWLAEGAHADGRASCLWAPARADDPLQALVVDRLRIDDLSLEEAERRIALREPGLEGSAVEALAELGVGEHSEDFHLDRAIDALVALIELDCADRPVLIHAEGSALRSPGLVRLAERLLESGLPVLVLLELRPEELPTRGRGQAGIGLDGAQPLDVAPLPDEQIRELLEAMLPLEVSLAARLTSRSAGNPRLALHLLGSLIRRDAVAAGPGGVALRQGVRLELPEDLAAVWRERLDEVLSGLGEDAWVALGAAALLGARVRMSDWRAACEAHGITGTSAVLRRLRHTRLATPTADRGFTFAHPILRDVIVELARVRGIYESACTVAVSAPSLAEDSGRRGELLADAGELNLAAPLLHQGANTALGAGDVLRAKALCRRSADALRALGVEPDSVEWAELHLLLCRLAVEEGDPVDAETHAERALALATRHGLAPLRAHALRWMAATDWLAQRPELALEGFQDALSAFEALDDPTGRARAHHGIAVVERSRARLDEALFHLERGLEAVAEQPNEALEAAIVCSVGDVRRRQGRLEEAEAAFVRGHRLALDCQEPALASTAVLGLGELARKRGDLDQAEAHYRHALALRRGGQLLKMASAQLNLALVSLLRGDYPEAEALLNGLIQRLDGDKATAVLTWARVSLLPVVAVRGDLAWNQALAPIRHALDQQRLRDPDVAWCLEHAGDRAWSVGKAERARFCWKAAAVHWREAGEQDRAALASGKLTRR